MEQTDLKREEASAAGRNKVSGAWGRHVLYRKELADHLRSKRFILLLLLIGGSAAAALTGARAGIEGALSDGASFAFLKLYTTGGSSIPSFMYFIVLVGPIIGITLGFDAVNSERSSGTLNRLVSQPIYRDSVIIGKFLAGLALIAVLIFVTGIVFGAAGVYVTGLRPSGEEMLRVLVFLALTVVYVAFWLALAILFSTVCRHTATSALAAIAVWLFFAIFMSMAAGMIANAVYPVNDEYSLYMNSYNNYVLKMNLNRISPCFLYSEAVSTIMDPTVRSVGVMTMSQLEGAVSGFLSFGQSLLLVWPHLTGMLALMIAVFGISYTAFMRQEIRAN